MAARERGGTVGTGATWRADQYWCVVSSAGSDLLKCLNLYRKNLILCTDSGLKRPILAIKLDG
jgi:hypothetical protein